MEYHREVNDVILPKNSCSPELQSVQDVKTVHEWSSRNAYLQNGELSSTNEDCQETKVASGMQWLYNVLDDISALSKYAPIYIEIPDGLLQKQVVVPHSFSHADSLGPKGHNAKDIVGDLLDNEEPNYEDGTWMTFRIRIPQTILSQISHQKVYRQSNGDNIREQTGTSIDTSNHHCI